MKNERVDCSHNSGIADRRIKIDLLQGTNDLLVLKALSLGLLHDLGVSQRIEQINEGDVPSKTRFSFSRLTPDGGGELAPILLGRVREQPPGLVLPPHQSRRTPARSRNRRLAAKRPVELHLYAKGGYGFGMRKQNLPTDQWIERFGDWLQMQSLLKK